MARSIRQHLSDLSGKSVRDYDFSRLAARFGKAAKARDARDLRNEMNRERQVALSEPHINMMRRAIEEAIEKESAELNGTLPVISMFEAAQIAKGAVKEASRDVGLQNLSTHLERRWKADKQAHLSASDIITLKDHYNRNFPKSAASHIVEGFTKSGWMDLPVSNLMDIASQIRSQSDFDYYIKEAGLHTNNPYNKKARNFILALLNGRVAQDDEWDDGEIDPDLNPTIFLDNTGDQEEGFVTIHANEPGAGIWAEDYDGSIMGSNWEADGPDFAYAIIIDEPGLVEKLQAEGYNVDDSQYYEMDESEWGELAQQDEQRRFDEKQMKLPGIKSKKRAPKRRASSSDIPEVEEMRKDLNQVGLYYAAEVVPRELYYVDGVENPDEYVMIEGFKDMMDHVSESNMDIVVGELDTKFSEYVVHHRGEYAVQVYKDGQPTPAYEYLSEIIGALSNYPVLDDEDLSRREYEEAFESISNEGRNVVSDDAPDDWEEQVWRWLWENNQGALEPGSDGHLWVSPEDIEEAAKALGFAEEDEDDWEDEEEPEEPVDPRQMKLPGVEGKRAQRLARSISKAVRG